QIRNAVLLGSAVLALLLMGGVFLVMRLAVSRALSPVQAMTQQAAAWSVGDVAGRFGDEVRPSELADLAGTLDALLGRLAAVLTHEQQLAGGSAPRAPTQLRG